MDSAQTAALKSLHAPITDIGAFAEASRLCLSACRDRDAAARVAAALDASALCSKTIALLHRAGRYARPEAEPVPDDATDLALLEAAVASIRLLRNCCAGSEAVQAAVCARADEADEAEMLDGEAPSSLVLAAKRVCTNPFLEGGEAYTKATSQLLRALLQCTSNACAGSSQCQRLAWPAVMTMAASVLSLPRGSVLDAGLAGLACGMVSTAAGGHASRVASCFGARGLMQRIVRASQVGRGAEHTAGALPALTWGAILVREACTHGVLHAGVESLAAPGGHDDALDDALRDSLLLLRLASEGLTLDKAAGTRAESGHGGVVGAASLQPRDVESLAGLAEQGACLLLSAAESDAVTLAWALTGSDAAAPVGRDAALPAVRGTMGAEVALASLDLLGDACAARGGGEALLGREDAGEAGGEHTVLPGVASLFGVMAEALAVLPVPVRARSDREAAAASVSQLVIVIGSLWRADAQVDAGRRIL